MNETINIDNLARLAAMPLPRVALTGKPLCDYPPGEAARTAAMAAMSRRAEAYALRNRILDAREKLAKLESSKRGQGGVRKNKARTADAGGSLNL